MGIDLFALNDDAEVKIFSMRFKTGSAINWHSTAAFFPDHGPISAREALYYATRAREALARYALDQEDDSPYYNLNDGDLRASLEEYASFCEQSGGYSMWV